MLEKNNFIIESAENGEEAVNLCKQQKFDVILMDIQMPILDGISASKRIREDLKINTPIIAQSANTVQKDIDACYATGVNDYLAKPFTEEQLLQKISLVLNLNNSAPFQNNQYSAVKSQKATMHWKQKALELAGNNLEQANQLINIFIQEIPKNIATLKVALKSKDITDLNKIGHKIKSSFRLFELNNEADLCFYFEKFDINSQEWFDAELKFIQLEKLCHQLMMDV